MPQLSLLLVEDNEIASLGVALALREEGFRVQAVYTGREVFGLVLHARPDVIILDISLPDLDGLTVAQTIREHWPELPIIFTSGHESSRGTEALLNARTSYLRKPYAMAELVVAIHRVSAP